MSYYCEIGFTEAKSEKELLNIIQRMTKEMWEQRFDILTELLKSESTVKAIKESNPDMITSWLRQVLTIRLFYWNKFELAGFCNIGKFKDFKSVIFQNSCDQNYDYSEYPENIEFFRKNIEQVKNMSDAEVKKVMPDYDTDDNIDTDYIRRSYLYRRIEHSLCITNYLYNNAENDSPFIRLDICATTDNARLLELKIYVKNILDHKK